MKRLSLFAALSWIVLSTLVVTPTIYTGVRFFQKEREKHLTSPEYQIRSIIQTSSIKRGLNTAFFAERLSLASDSPQNIYHFDTKLGEKKLFDTAVFREVSITKRYPDALYIEYEMRIPHVKIGDYQNVAIDRDHIAFPIMPFFASRKIPEIYLGEGNDSVIYNQTLNHPRLKIALEYLSILEEKLKEYGGVVEKIDVTRIDSPSYGKRELIVLIKGVNGYHFLRMQTKELEKQVENYLSLQQVLSKGDKVIDLRIDHIAYIDEVKHG